MKQIIPFVKDITFSNKIYEITSVDLKHELEMENNDSIVGYFLVSGKYKMNKISINEEEFSEKLKFDITLDNKYVNKDIIIDIDNFYYEIIDDEILRIHIDVLLDNLKYLKEQRCIEDEQISIDNASNILIDDDEIIDLNTKENEIENLDKEFNTNINESINNTINNSVFLAENNFATYKVHIIRQNDSLEKITELYEVSKEELEKYNDLENIVSGSKIIIPLKNE